MRQLACSILLFAFFVLSAEGSRSEWTRMCRPGSDIRSLSFAGDTLFAVGSKNRMYRTTDTGVSWRQVNLHGARSKPNRVYTSLGLFPECAFLGTSTGTIFQLDSRLSDWSWASTCADDEILAFTRLQGKAAVTFVACGPGNGIRVSSDFGKTWMLSNAGLATLNVTALGSGRSLADSTGQVVFAATHGNGVFVSYDNCQTWLPTAGAPSVLTITALQVDGDRLVIAGSGGKVCSSPDGGTSWQDVGVGLPYTAVSCLTIVGEGAGEWVYCGTIDAGVWRCAAAGGHWSACNTGLENLRINTIIEEGGALYIGTNEGVYRSFNWGASWTAIGDGVIPQLCAIHAMPTEEPDRKDVLVAGTACTYGGTTFYSPSASTFSTTDGGTHWTTTNALFEGDVISITHQDQLLFLLSEGNMDHLSGLNISSDRGETWELRDSYRAPRACMEIVPRKDHSGLDCYIGSIWGLDTGVEFSGDTGRTWAQITTRPSYSMGSTDSFLIVHSSGAVRTSDHGATWEDITSNLGGHTVGTFFDDGERLLASIVSTGGLLMTTDGGDTWPSAGLDGKDVTSVVPIDRYLLATANGKVFAATRDSMDWIEVTDDLAAVSVGSITATSQMCYVLDFRSKSIWKRPTKEILQMLQPRASAPTLIYPPDNTTLASNAVGLVWTKAVPEVTRYWVEVAPDSGFQGRTVDSLVTDTTSGWVGSAAGRYWWHVRAQNSSGWGPFSEVRTFVLSPCGVEQPEAIPSIFVLYRNFPNPFNPSTTIRYGLPSREHVSLTIFNMLGQQVSILQNGEQDAGDHEVKFAAQNLPSGVYFYCLKAGNFTETKRLLFLR